MDEDIINPFLRVVVSMATIGAALGISSWLTFEWIVFTELTNATEVVRLGALMLITGSAPLIAGVLGIFEGLRQSDIERAVVVAGSGLFGGVIMILLGALFLSQMTAGGGGSDIALMDIVTLGGLVGIACALAGCITTILNKK